MKVTRLIVGIMLILLIVQAALTATLWAESFVFDYDTVSDQVVNIIFGAQLLQLLLSVIVFGGAQWLIKERAQLLKQEMQAAMERRGGMLNLLFSPSYWNTRWNIQSPFAPRWLGWLSLTVTLCLMVLGITEFCLMLGGAFQPTSNSNMRLFTVVPIIWGLQSLIILLSKWRELSQPAASASPEVRPS
jgi:hypothetical protein